MVDLDTISGLFREAEAVITDNHFVYKSGKHGPAYVNKDALMRDPQIADALTAHLAHWAEQSVGSVDAVIGPVMAGAIVAHDVARHLHRKRSPLALYADKDGDGFVIKRGFDKVIPGKRILVVEDIINTGGSVRKVVDAVKALDGKVMAVAALCNRGGASAESLNVPELFALMNVSMKMYEPGLRCPLCRDHVPINTELGHGRKYVAKYGQP